MNQRNESIKPTPGVNANDMRDANDPIYPDTVTDEAGNRKVGNVNPDPVTGEHGSHPVGAGLGAAAGGALAGIGLGAAAGPVGAAIGAVVGGVAGAFAGKNVAEAIDPTVEDAFWRDEYPNREYYQPGVDYETIQPAYQYGWESRTLHANRSWDEAKEDVRRQWETEQSEKMPGTWEDAQRPIRDAWDRVDAQFDDKQRTKPR